MAQILEQEQILPISGEAAWEFFSNPANLSKLTPPGVKFRTVSGGDEEVHEGQVIVHRVGVLPGISLKWVSEIVSVESGVGFVDEQRSGPFKSWRHEHSFEEVEGGVKVLDRVEYVVGWGPAGWVARRLFVDRQVKGLFEARRELLAELFGEMEPRIDANGCESGNESR